MSKAARHEQFQVPIFWYGQANSPLQRAREPLLAVAVFLAHHVV